MTVLGGPPLVKDSNVKITSFDNSSDNSGPAVPHKASKLDVLIQGVALFSDGYNIQIIGYMNSILAKLLVRPLLKICPLTCSDTRRI